MVKHFRSRYGATLTELMVAVAIMSIGILGFFGAFRYISVSLHVSRARTLATNLAQERVEALKNESYYELLITTASAVDNNFSPGIVYDNGSYGPETISIGGITFTRYTYVALAQIDAGAISTVTFTFPDTGMKQITVHVVWNQSGNRRKYSLTNLLENPNVNPLDSGLAGSVVFQNGAAFEGAIVRVQENPDYNGTSAADGSFSFRVYHGSYTIKASSAGYFDAISSVQSVGTGSNVTAPPLVMQAIGSGTISGIAWMNKDLVISQVVVSTAQAGDNETAVPFDGFQAQYVELFNPTTFAIAIGDGISDPAVKLNFLNATGCSFSIQCDNAQHGIKMNYISTWVAPGKYYLFANTGTFVTGGVFRAADAVIADNADTFCVDGPDTGNRWALGASPPIKLILNPDHGGTAWISRGGSRIDSVGWSDSANVAAGFEGTAVPFDGSGFTAGNQLVRISSPAAALVESTLTTYGRAYDSGNNHEDFVYRPLNFAWVAPSTSTMDAVTVLTGKPAVGANVAASDPYSGSTVATPGYISSGTLTLLYAPFNLVGVGTSPVAGSCAGDCWDIVIATTGYLAAISTIAVQQGVVTRAPNSTTSPAWMLANHAGVHLTTISIGGYVQGVVRSISNQPIAGIQVFAGGMTKTTGANGAYFAAVSSGPVTIIANPNNANTQYVQDMAVVTVETGQLATADFELARGGTLMGYVTSGTTPLPNFIIAATYGAGSQAGTGTSNTSGYFYIRNLSTGTYNVAPVLDSGQDSLPNTVSKTLSNAGETVFVGTFTVSGAFGNIAGTVSNNTLLVTSGALLLASTATIPATPNAIAASSGPAQTPLYAVSSKADGTYTLPVRGGSTYYLSVYVPQISNLGAVTITTKTYSGIYVAPALTTAQNVTIP